MILSERFDQSEAVPRLSVRRRGHGTDAASLDRPLGDAGAVWELLEAVSDAVIVTDPSGTVLAWNQAAEDLYGWTADEALGTSITSLTVPSDAATPASQILETLAQGEPWSGEYLVCRKDGTLFLALVTDVPLHDEDGTVVAIAGVSRSATSSGHEESSAGQSSAAASVALHHAPDAIHILHDTLVRPEFPPVPGVSFSAAHLAAHQSPGMSGDWYDAFVDPDGRVIVAVGDVTGHGLTATRFMAKMRHSTRAYACMGWSLDVILRALDQFVQHFATDGLLVTMQLAALDPERERITAASAGHPPPVVLGARGPRLVETANGPLLGLTLDHPVYEVSDHEWPRGSALIMYSDGLVERRGESIDTGMARLVQSVSSVTVPMEPAAIQDAAIAGCLDGIFRHDDACIMVATNDAT
jgi:PAS domain S-box-containing protein